MVKERKQVWAFHCHHDVLAEWCWDYDGRVRAIKRDKPTEEQELRLRLFKLIPIDRVPSDLLKAGEAYYKAVKAFDKAREAYDKAGKAYYKARGAFDKAVFTALPLLEELHRELCPNCPWDGKTIFSREEV